VECLFPLVKSAAQENERWQVDPPHYPHYVNPKEVGQAIDPQLRRCINLPVGPERERGTEYVKQLSREFVIEQDRLQRAKGAVRASSAISDNIRYQQGVQS
jgi:hypothetical protein